MYNTKFHDPAVFADLVERAVKTLQGVKFDTIVFRGFSGAVVGPVVALQLGKPWALVRKVGDNAHSSRVVEGDVSGDYVIIDDFIDSGETIRKIVSECRDGRCVGAYFYDQAWNDGCGDPEFRAHLESRIEGIEILSWTD
jgi:adenine/guanine phosphoribosyltransferase-like PRPP-binding protein